MVCCTGLSIRPSVPVLLAFISGCAVHMSHIQLAQTRVHTQLHLCPPRAVLSSQPIAGRSANQICCMWVWTEAWFSVYKVCASSCNPSARMLHLFLLLLSSAYLFRYMWGVWVCYCFLIWFDRGLNTLNWYAYSSFKHKRLVLCLKLI